MNISLIGHFFPKFWGSILALLTTWMVSIFGESVFLMFPRIDLDVAAKIIPVLLSLFVALAGWRWTQRKSKEEAMKMAQERIHAEQDQYRQNVDWLIEKRFIEPGATKGEIDDKIKEYFPKD